ncbi:hypothetical protein POTOM_055544 [Populus tomentosa]|uniref:Ubiquitin-like protease family profile domain-containing protein n=1 Tax=Populus tomentosa TaxID=118781 RepID=A0A8X8C7B7_POPTO|nr:hypothetical protein POTOM_055544 [Populus tomentosa]
MDHGYFVISYQRKKRDHHVFCLSIHMTGPPDLNLVLTEMSSPLVNKLMACAQAVAVGNLKLADVLFEEMEGLTAEETSEVTRKVVSYFAEALARRVHGVYPRNPFPLLPSSIVNTQRSLRCFEIIPATIDYVAAAHFSGKQPVHFIDFSIMLDRWEYDSLLRHFPSLRLLRPNRVFRLTNIGPNPCKDSNHIQESQRKLTELARQLSIDFQLKQFEANIPADIEECALKLESTSEDEIVIVRWEFELHKLLAVEGAIKRVLSKLKELKPKIMLIEEQEADHNSPDFFERFALSFQYYSRVFNYFNWVPCETDRKEILERHWRRQISNVVACEGIDRVERHQTFYQWKERLRRAGFRPGFATGCKFPIFYPFGGHQLFFASLWEPIDPTEFSRGVGIGNPITIQDASVSSVIEPEEVCSSDSEHDSADDNSNTLGIFWNQKKWSPEAVREYLVSSFTERESRRINRWMSRRLTGNSAGSDKKLSVCDTSLASLLRIPPSNTPIFEAKQYYVDDSVINAYFELLRKRWKEFPNLYMKNYSLPTWIMTFWLTGKWTESKVLSYLNTEKIAGTSKLFIPVCLKNHWILICVDIERRALLWLDSLSFDHAEKDVISRWIIEHLMPKLGYDNAQEWQFLEPVDLPRQTNEVDCGIFVMKYADCLALGDHFPFTQQDIPLFRHHIFLDIYRGKLRPQILSKNFRASYYA